MAVTEQVLEAGPELEAARQRALPTVVVRPVVILRNEQNGFNFDELLPPLRKRPNLLSEVWSYGFTKTFEGSFEWGGWKKIDEEPHDELWELEDNVSTILTVRGRWRRELADQYVEYLAYPENSWPDLGDPFFSQISQKMETEIHYVVRKSLSALIPGG